MPVKLWSTGNTTIYSDVFLINPGKVCMLYATGLEREKVRVTDAEMKTCQKICVRRIVHLAEGVLSRGGVLQEWVVTGVDVYKVVDDLVQVNNCCWELSHANNLRVIGIPGTYRLELNDATAVGYAQVYGSLFDVDQLPPQVAHLFF